MQYYGTRLIRSASTLSRPSIAPLTKNIDTEVFRRISSSYQLLSNKSRKFRYSTVDCSEVYRSYDTSLLGDIFKYPRINKELFDLLRKYYYKSSSIRSLVLGDLKSLWHQGEYQLIKDILSQISKQNFVAGFQPKKRKANLTVKSDVFNSITLFAAISGEPLVACLFITTTKLSDLVIENETVNILLKCLTSYKGQQHQYYCLAILRLITVFPKYRFTAEQTSDIIEFSLSKNSDCYFTNLIFEKLEPHIKEFNESERLTSALQDLILSNLTLAQYKRAMLLWKHLSFLPGVFNDTQIHSAFLTQLPLKELEFFISSCSLDTSNNEIIDPLLRYYGNQGKVTELQEILSQVSAPVQRRTLSALLDAFSSQGKQEETEKLLLLVMNSKQGISSSDFNALVKGLLNNGMVTKAIEIITNLDINISKSAHITLFKYILRQNILRDNRGFIESMAVQMKRIQDDKVCIDIFPLIVTYLTENYGVSLSRAFFVKVLNSLEGMKSWSDKKKLFDMEKFHISNSIYDIMTISKDNTMRSLFIILDKALKEVNISVVKWCIFEMRQNGTLLRDILQHIKETDGILFKKLFKSSIVKSIN